VCVQKGETALIKSLAHNNLDIAHLLFIAGTTTVRVCVCVCVCAAVCVSVCVSLCLYLRTERRERESVCVRERGIKMEIERSSVHYLSSRI